MRKFKIRLRKEYTCWNFFYFGWFIYNLREVSQLNDFIENSNQIQISSMLLNINWESVIDPS